MNVTRNHTPDKHDAFNRVLIVQDFADSRDHQFLSGLNIHASPDDRSYEYATSDRPSQYYGPMHWDIARSALLKTYGR